MAEGNDKRINFSLDPKSMKHWFTILVPVLLALFGGPKLSEVTGWTESGVQTDQVDQAVEDKFDSALVETKTELKAEMGEKVQDLKVRIEKNLTATRGMLGSLKELMLEKMKTTARNEMEVRELEQRVRDIEKQLHGLEAILEKVSP